MTAGFDRLLSYFGVRSRTAGGYAVLLLMMAGLAVFSWMQLEQISASVRVLVELDNMDVAIATTDGQLARLNTMVHSFMRTRKANDIAATQAECDALMRTVSQVFATFGQHSLLVSHQDEIMASLARHAVALNAAATASRRHHDAVDRFLAAAIPIATTVYAMGANSSPTDSAAIAQSKMWLQASFAASRAAVTRYIVTLQPADAESAHQEMAKFKAAVTAQGVTGERRFDRFVDYIRDKLPTYDDEADAIEWAVASETEAETEIDKATGDLDRIFDDLKQVFAQLRTETVAAQLNDVAMLHRLLLAVTGLTILLGLSLAWLIGTSIARPIVRMTVAMRHLAEGKLDVVIPAQDHRDEIGRMAAATEIFKQTALALRASETRYRNLLENLMEGVYQTTPEGRLLSANQAMADIMGWPSPEEMLAEITDIGRQIHVDPSARTILLQTLREKGSIRGLELSLRRRDGREVLVLVSARGIMADGVLIRLEGTLVDITERKAAEDEIKHLAFYDPLTGLPNRRLLLDRLQQAVASSSRSKREGALLFIDLDNFKTLNDTLGHDIGDLLLQQVAERLITCVREGDTVARLGGDEFVVMLEDLSANLNDSATQTETVGKKILTVLNQPYLLAGHQQHSTPSIGATLFNDRHSSVDELLKRADLAMYQAKSAGRNTLRFFDPDLQEAVNTRAALENDLRRGIKESQFLLYYQPQIDGALGLVGAEALLRWRHPERGLVLPTEFIGLAEETGLILPLGHWVLETACRQMAIWAGRTETAHLTLAVNVSARQFRQADFVEQVLDVVARTGADPRKLKLELTESLFLDNVEDVIAKMTALNAKGLNFSLDDFGTGYSSLSYLKRLPLSQLKIDQSFVQHVLTDRNDATFARTIVALGRSLGLAVIAEGVETEEQREFLAEQGCSAYQGFLFSHPLPVDDFSSLL
ncbi:EAL domain-containing protein [Telmatospirillum sp.]|uniref:EAL domain-containing protein n=1 Tax=Telmatospirillum sp. TaxID=2079197 RepID=UPI002849764F|nr:EAL domain-containing protein [Telmatospirillum sp.]MDR3436144.1 EAL domain-containing protein [Telmatospirillum sp.]